MSKRLSYTQDQSVSAQERAKEAGIRDVNTLDQEPRFFSVASEGPHREFSRGGDPMGEPEHRQTRKWLDCMNNQEEILKRCWTVPLQDPEPRLSPGRVPLCVAILRKAGRLTRVRRTKQK